jgi:hypothetical protein
MPRPKIPNSCRIARGIKQAVNLPILARQAQTVTPDDGRNDLTKRLREENAVLRRQAAELARHNEYLRELL